MGHSRYRGIICLSTRRKREQNDRKKNICLTGSNYKYVHFVLKVKTVAIPIETNGAVIILQNVSW